MPRTATAVQAVPEPPPQTFGPDAVRRGATKAHDVGCLGCHSENLDGAGRWIENGGVPDLRYMPRSVHRDWYAIVLGGSHQKQGMLSFGAPTPGQPAALTAADADDIHAPVVITPQTLQQNDRVLAHESS
jgi:hypothetical protein